MIVRIALQMARTNLVKMVRQKRALFVMFIMPIVLIAILGSAFGNVFGGKGIPQFTVAVYNEDQGQAGQKLVDFLQSQKSQLVVKTVSSIDDARQAVNKGKADVDLWIPQDYSAKVGQGSTAEISVEAPLNHSTEASVMNAMVKTYGQMDADIRYIGEQSAKANHPLQPQSVDIQQKDPGMNPIGAGTYYAIGMMAMFLLTHAINRGSDMVEQRESDLYKRMIASPASRYALATGHWISNFIVLVVQGSILLICARYLLNIHFGPVEQTAAVLLGYAFSLSGISIAIGTLIRNQAVVSGVSNIGSQVAAVLGGSIWPIYNFPKVMQTIAHILPNGAAIGALVSSVMGTTTGDLTTPLWYMVGIGLVLSLAAGSRYGRQLA